MRGVRGGLLNELSVRMKAEPRREGVRDGAKLLDFFHPAQTAAETVVRGSHAGQV